jgi:two-component system KDP operon response regulator KdpE
MSEATAPVVLVVEDEPLMRRFLRAALPLHGYQLQEAATGLEAIAMVERAVPDLVLLDLGLPDLDGLEVTRRLRAFAAMPIIVLSARGREGAKVEVLDAGADDYVTKPFGTSELLARMRVALRRSLVPTVDEPVLDLGALKIDFASREVWVNGASLTERLTPTEFDLLTCLARHEGEPRTHRQLLEEVWGPGRADDLHSLRVYVAQLRRKLEPDPHRPRLLQTEPGVGYRLTARPVSASTGRR